MPHVDVAGTRLHYHVAGEGPLALLVHGFPFDATMWLDQLSRLRTVRRCVAPDLRGFGASAPTTERTLPMERHAQDMAQLIATLADGDAVADVVALSMGGYVVLALWENHPERVRSLALLDTRAEPDDEEGRAGRDATISSVVQQGRTPLATDLLGSLLAPDADATARARVRTMIEGTRVETIVAALRGMRDRPDRTALLSTIDVPTLVVAGEHDAPTPPEAMQVMADTIPGARFEVVPGAGHVTAVERPEVICDLLAEFWGAQQ
ncbi:MAG TPA: alpha/beta fold hydrolase [Nitriliruptorales bacterium]|nr:alpha/beta fold hydrolase [Nitriliruptorales bacterium]